MPCPTLGDACLVHSMSKIQKTLQANGRTNVKSSLDTNLFCLLYQEASTKIISYLLMSYAYTKLHISSGNLKREEGFSQGDKEVRGVTAGKIKIWVKG